MPPQSAPPHKRWHPSAAWSTHTCPDAQGTCAIPPQGGTGEGMTTQMPPQSELAQSGAQLSPG